MTELVGQQGIVTISIHGEEDRPGEIQISSPSGTRTLIAYCDEYVPRNRTVLIMEKRGPMHVQVTPN